MKLDGLSEGGRWQRWFYQNGTDIEDIVGTDIEDLEGTDIEDTDKEDIKREHFEDFLQIRKRFFQIRL